jgi:hypothetical protein
MLCRSHRGNYIVSAIHPIVVRGEMRSDTVHYHYSLKPLFFHTPLDSTLEMIKSSETKGRKCISLDYLEEENIYIYSGKYDNKFAVLLMDTTFNVISDLTSPLASLFTKWTSPQVRFVDTEHFLADNGQHTYLVSRKSKELKLLSPGYVCGLSHDHRYVVLQSKGIYKILDLKTSQEKIIERDSRACEATFSPDDKYIAFLIRISRFPSDYKRLYIYDIDNDEIYKTEVTPSMKGIIAKSLLWID